MVWSSRKPRQRWTAKRIAWVVIALVTTPLALSQATDAAGRRDDAVTVTATHVVTNRDRVPRACAAPTVVAKRSGAWSQATIWSTGAVPGAEAQVLIPRGATVTYDLAQAVRLRCVEVQGRLRFGDLTRCSMSVIYKCCRVAVWSLARRVIRLAQTIGWKSSSGILRCRRARVVGRAGIPNNISPVYRCGAR